MRSHTVIASLCVSTLGLGGCIGGIGDGGDVSDESACAASEQQTFYDDGDGDGHGDPDVSLLACTKPANFVSDASDCNPTDPTAYSGAQELCGDQVDNDCVGGDPCLLSLAAQWSFSDVGGTSATDASGNLLTGVLRNGVANTPTAQLTFDGIDDYVEIADSELLRLDVGTVSFWFNPAALGVQQSILSKDSNGTDTGGHLSFYVEPDGQVRVRLQSDTESFEIVSPPIVAKTWHHVAFTFGGSEGMTLYVNGVEVGNDPFPLGIATNPEPLVIGAGTDISGDETAEPISAPFGGEIADVRIHDRQLLISELRSLRTVTAPVGAGS